jgi:hypothetical protein
MSDFAGLAPYLVLVAAGFLPNDACSASWWRTVLMRAPRS